MYNYIITGAGAAGLSLVTHMILSGKFSGKKILLLEKAPKMSNDRTWCFWEQDEGIFEKAVYQRWHKLHFHSSDGYSSLNDISPYQYKLIRGIDFYNYCFDIINSSRNITVKYGNVERCISDHTGTYVIFNGEKIAGEYIFNSILFEKPPPAKSVYMLLQHFKGWVINSKKPVFTASEATLMDFRTSQSRGTTFIYVMPFSETRALVEYTLFSGELLREEEYDDGLKNYCSNILGIGEYEIEEEETGVIPMTNYKFPPGKNNIINIGTAGGQTKSSSGYTFKFIQKHSAEIVHALKETGKPFVSRALSNRRFEKYDSTLLNILYNKKMPGGEIFSTLVKNNRMRDVLKFLDNETSLMEEFKIIRCLPTLTFLKSALT